MLLGLLVGACEYMLLFGLGCLLIGVHLLVFVVRCFLCVVVRCLVFVVACCSLCEVCFVLRVVCCSPSVCRCLLLFVVCCLLRGVMMCVIQCVRFGMRKS